MKPAAILLTTLLLTQILTHSATATPTPPANQIAQADLDDGTLTPQQVQQTAKNITVRITTEKNGGSGVIIAQKGGNYLILTNAHVVRRATKIQIQAPDGQKYQATPIDGGFDAKYDLALLQFTSKAKYTLANLSSVSGSPLEPERTIYSAGFPFDSKNIRISSGQISQLSDLPFNDGTQIGYVTNKGEKGIRQGMSGGAIFDAQGNLLGINTVGVAPILPDYTYNDGSKPLAKLKAQYRQANWGIPTYNFLTNVKADILYGYDNLPKVERQVTPTGYMAKLNIKARQMTVRIENSGGNGSGVIVAKQGSTYYVLTAKHVLQNPETKQVYTNPQIVTYDQDRRNAASTVVAEGVDLAVVKFSSNNNYPVARLGEYSPNDNDLAFVGGFPGRLNINSPLWQWQLNPGFVREKEKGKFHTQTKQSFSNGYDLIYSSITYGGMSGGPIFDVEGNVIGIHGRAESTNLKSLGMSIYTFIGLAAKLQVAPNLLTITKTNPSDLDPGDVTKVIALMRNISKPQVWEDGIRWLSYGNQLYRTGQFDKSTDAFERAISKNEVLLGRYGKSLSLWNNEKYQLAEATIAKAIALIPVNKRAEYYYFWKYQSIILINQKKYPEAIKSLDIAIALESDDISLLYIKAFIFYEKDRHKEAISMYDIIIRKQPGFDAHYLRGLMKYALGNRQSAIDDFNSAIAIKPKYAYSYYIRGKSKYQLEDKQGAISDFNQSILLDDYHAESYHNRGLAKYDLGDKQGAIADYNRAISSDSKNPEYYYHRGLVEYDLGDYHWALGDYNQAIYLNSKFDSAYNNRGLTKFALGNKQEAITDFDQAIALNPKNFSAYNNRASTKSALGNNQAAIIDYDRAIALNPENSDAYYNRGNIKYKLGNKQEAIIDYNRAIYINPKYGFAYDNRGLAKSALGNNQGAIADMSDAAALSLQQRQMDLHQKAMGLLKKLQSN